MSSMSLYHFKQGSQIPTTKKGMFLLLKGKMRVRTHWKLRDGISLLQKQYLAHVYEQ